MPNPENLKGHGWVKGQSGNPNGRPKGTKGLSETLRELLEKDGLMIIENVYEVDENNKETGNVFKRAKVRIPKKDIIALAVLKKSAKGDMRAIEFMFDRMEGMAVQKHETEDALIEISYFDGYENESEEYGTNTASRTNKLP